MCVFVLFVFSALLLCSRWNGKEDNQTKQPNQTNKTTRQKNQNKTKQNDKQRQRPPRNKSLGHTSKREAVKRKKTTPMTADIESENEG